ncbi:MAG: 3-mercaptopyruvate sulfurtransferase [Rhodobacteraceae bacterium]|nr:3-mercaptopyruvate sulfurtransferase [Paracoccaceae bacterium]
MAPSNQLVSTEWLESHLMAPDLRILDASWYMPADNRNPRAEYETCHIAGARYFDIDDIADQRSELPHMAPPVEKFVSRMRAMGIGDGHRVVIYDSAGLFSAARVWWMFRLFGKSDVVVLDGGLKKWLAEGRPTADMPPILRDRHFTARRDANLVRDVTQVAASAKLKDAQIIDARSPGRVTGEEAEPRPGMRSGRIPGSSNVYYKDLINEDGTMKNLDALRGYFAHVDFKKPVIATCGSGVTAGILALALARLGHRDVAVYDGSWSEWGKYPDLKIETGPL